MAEGEFTPRRGQRIRQPSFKALESVNSKKFIHETSVEQISDDSFEDDEEREKPSVLHESEVLHGEKMFAFQSRKRKDGLLQKAAQVAKTPSVVRNVLKKKIAAQVLEENSSSEHDFSESGSEYEVSEESEAESNDVSEISEDKSSSEAEEEPPKRSLRIASKARAAPKSRGTQKKYVIKTDDYFTNHTTKKIITSNHTLDKLETPRLPQDQLQKLLAKVKLSDDHFKSVKDLSAQNCANFNKWLYLLHENFNILLYGLGSKRQILERFHEEQLKELPVIVINGFFPSLTIKDVLDAIIVDLLELKENPSNLYEACELIETEFNYIPDTHLYLIVHNIEMVRGGKTQSIFAKLANIENIHLIASIDHINAPLIWDHSKLCNFNFTWWDVTSFQPYIDETSFESSMMVQRTGTLALSSLRNVFLSLTSNSKGIYTILVKYQLENAKNQYYQGFAFKDLYSSCREAFLVSSDLALRAQLTEFVDHKMVKFKRSIDGTENLIIPISNTILQQFLNEQCEA